MDGGRSVFMVNHLLLELKDVRLKSNGLSEYEESFKREAIDGMALMALTEGDMKDLGMKMGHRKKFLMLLSNYEERAGNSKAFDL